MNEKLFRPKVFTIPGGHSFVNSLAKGLLTQLDDPPEALSRAKILLPTRRSCRALRDAFLYENGGTPILLPQLLPIGDIDEDELQISASELIDSEIAFYSESMLSIPQPIEKIRRQILLTRLILAKPGSTETPDQAARLANELACLLDQIHTEQLGFDQLQSLVPDDFATHWQITLDFLTILTDAWPKFLEAEGILDPTERRNRLLKMRAAIWRNSPPKETVIAAGSTGSIPATAELLSTIARLPQGAVILPGLDLNMDDPTWNQLEPTHPQFSMARLLRQMDVPRSDVAYWPVALSDVDISRTHFVNAVLSPIAAPQSVIDPITLENAVKGISRLDCPGEREEAAAIALMLRETLETPGKTAALVTPDRNLARRVSAELKRWDIEIDDSAGKPMGQTGPGSFLRLVANAIDNKLAPIHLLGLLKHPLTGMGYPPNTLLSLVTQFELTLLRGPRPNEGIEGLRQALPKNNPNLDALITKIADILKPLLTLPSNNDVGLADIMHHLVRCTETMANSNTQLGQELLWIDEAGEAVAEFVAEIIEWGNAIQIKPGRLTALLETLMSGRVVRTRQAGHPRLAIWGTLEGRLQTRDLLILGGLNEGTWPPQTLTNPWMSRPMMFQFGLPLPERRIGLSAHDFAQGLNARTVALTRAERVDGTPTVPCRWLRRIDNFLVRLHKPNSLVKSTPWLEWIEEVDRPSTPERIAAPRPTPPVTARPTRLSVTEVETLIRDPYAVYARHILGLKPMEPIDADPSSAERGKIVHQILEEFIIKYPDNLPENAEKFLLDIGKRHFDTHISRSGVRAFWWPRFQRIASWFIEYERQRRATGWRPLAAEVQGSLTFPGLVATFTLTARADRIDINLDEGLSIIDYKTGQPPSTKQVAAGLAPQLPLEASIANIGGFEGVPRQPIADLIYVQLSGGRQPGQEQRLKLNVTQTIQNTMSGLIRLVHNYENPATPYLSQPRPMFASRFGNYDHLARLKEWGGRRDKT